MHDPFPIPRIPLLSKAVQPLADFLGFPTLPLHIHEVLIAFLGYTWINSYFAPWVSKLLFPEKYPKLSPDKKLNWDVHVVSLVQSSLINVLALWVMFHDNERWEMDWQQRVWGYTGAAGMIQGLAAGYFLWDLVITLQNVKAFGPGMLAHAMCALTVFSFGFRPFLNFYSCPFILYELSSPFLNFHWFFDKLGLTGSRRQLYNGLLLLFTFFSCRLVWGTYQSIRVYQDVWRAVNHTPAAAGIHFDVMNATSPAAMDAAAGKSAMPIHDDIMRFAGEEYVPLWLGITYLFSNLVLNTLNFYWFGKMIEAIRKRFAPQKDKRKEKTIAMKTTGVNGSVKIHVDQTEVRRRNIAKDELDTDSDAAVRAATMS